MKYRADIDGLRAVAVLAVVVFHLQHTWFPRGYLGVDLFFVISGYLISQLIWAEAREHRFSIANFYRRRIRRLMPALVTVLLVTSIASAAILLPADLTGYGKSLLAALAFVANIYFWRDTNYFARASEEKPLLHLWTLSVEEQFYIFFPLLLVLLALRPRALLPVLWTLVLASLLANVYLIKIGGASPAFYLLPTRAWELGAGALVALHRPVVLRESLARGLRWAAAALILLGLTYVGPWPRIVPDALPVVIGAAVLILVGAPRTSVLGHFLAHRVTNHFGLISYSLYLWHWPVIVLSSYMLVREPSVAELVAMAVVSYGLAVLTWRTIELPLRDRALPFSRVAWITGTGALISTLAAAAFIWSAGLPARLAPDAAAINRSVGTHFRCPVTQLIPFGASRACDLTLTNRAPDSAEIVLVGNSHAQMYAPLLTAELARAGRAGLLVPLNACLPMPDINISRSCAAKAATNLAAIEALPAVTTVIVALNWPTDRTLVYADGQTVDGRPDAAMADAVMDLAIRLAPRKVVVIGPIDTPGFDIASKLGRQIRFGIEPRSPSAGDAVAFRDRYAALFDRLDTAPGLTFVRPDQVQCDAARCAWVTDGLSLFSDSNHLASPALPLFAPLFSGLTAPVPAQ